MLTTPNLNGNLGIDHKVEDGITLGEFIKDIKPDTYVAIGAGSGFFFIGKVEDLLHDIPMIDMHYHFMAVRDTIPRKRVLSSGETIIRQSPYVPHIPFLQHNVEKYYARRVPDEPAMWVIDVDGEEAGTVWLLSEYGDSIESFFREFNAARTCKKNKLAE